MRALVANCSFQPRSRQRGWSYSTVGSFAGILGELGSDFRGQEEGRRQARKAGQEREEEERYPEAGGQENGEEEVEVGRARVL